MFSVNKLRQLLTVSIMTINLKYTTVLYIPLLLCASVIHAQGIHIEAGASFVINGNASLVLNDAGITNNGTLDAGTGTILFKGSAATAGSFISGAGSSSFYNLSLDKSANGIQLNKNISIVNTLSLVSGDSIFLNNHTIDLGSSGSITGETNTRRITGLSGGYIQSTQVLNAPAAVNAGNLGLLITSSSNLGSTIVRRGHVQQTNGTNLGIGRYYDVAPANNSGLNATLRFYYQDNELTGITEEDLIPFTSADLGVTWNINDYNTLDVVQNFIEQNGYNELNRITLASLLSPLPVKQILFNAHAADGQNILSWTTLQEYNLGYFEIERSADNRQFNKLHTTPAKGNTLNSTAYNYTDAAPLPGINYYRLKLVDVNGKFTWSQTIAVKQQLEIQHLAAYPNPAAAMLYLSYSCLVKDEYRLRITDYSGKVVIEQNVVLQKGVNKLDIPVSNLSAGIYSLQLTSKTSNHSTTFIKVNQH
jgi:Secretion system C-terminal sorting domain